MSLKLLATGGPDAWKRIIGLYNSLALATCFTVESNAAIGNGTTAGRLRTTATGDFRIGQFDYSKAATDNLWDLSLETDTTATQFRAYWLYLDSAGAATFVAGTNEATAADALAGLPIHDETKSIAGVYVAGVSTDFDAAGGLAAQGTITDGIPDGAWIGVPGQRYAAPRLGILRTK